MYRDKHPRLHKPIHDERHVRVICIGAGASGLVLAYKLQRSFENFELTIYEKNEQIAGTWFENKYPGCACDIPAHNYTWTFEPKSDWSAVYAGADEIRNYFETFSRKYGLHQYCKLKHQVSFARWNEDTDRWDLEITDLSSGLIVKDHCDFLINASGLVNAWKFPKIPGLERYKGPLIHSATWDPKIDLTGKHVGLIGNGSSAIQILPAICPQVSKVTNFIRGSAWITPLFGTEQHKFTDQEQHKFTHDPLYHLKFRKEAESLINAAFPLFDRNSELQKKIARNVASTMKKKLKNDALAAKLIPSWGVGCRRNTPGPGYLEALSSEKVKVVHGEIDRITERGCVSKDGQEHPVDILICATGFDTSFKPRFPIIGLGGKGLAEEWAEEPKGYLGIAAPNFPNYLIFVGPNSPIGNGPLLCVIEAQADYMLKLIDRWQTENIRTLSPRMEAVEDFIAYKDQFMEHTVWSQPCRSIYNNGNATGKVIAIWPGSTLHYLETIAQPRYEDWIITHSGNRFAFLGNGYSQTEVDRTADWAYYLRNYDDSPYLSRRKQLRVVNKSGTVHNPPIYKKSTLTTNPTTSMQSRL